MLNYLRRSQKYLQQAKEHMKKKNYTQASEKLWGAAALMVKAVAEKNHYKHDGHAHLFNVIHNLVEKTKDEEIRRYFSAAHLLHINFYENWLKPSDVRAYGKDVEKLIHKLRQLL